jgi:hypothetical protein
MPMSLRAKALYRGTTGYLRLAMPNLAVQPTPGRQYGFSWHESYTARPLMLNVCVRRLMRRLHDSQPEFGRVVPARRMASR